MSRPIYLAIMAAYEAGRGIHLTADEVHELGLDDAIAARAATLLEDDDEFVTNPGFTWTKALAEVTARLANAGTTERQPSPREALKPSSTEGEET